MEPLGLGGQDPRTDSEPTKPRAEDFATFSLRTSERVYTAAGIDYIFSR